MTGVGYNQMERLIMLGTGNALVTRCYNTCFAIQDDDEYFLVDAGGGNGIMRQLQDADISMAQIHHIFLTHEHTDHLLGMIWMIRMIATKMRREQYEGNLRIYCHSALVETVRTIANLTLPKKFTMNSSSLVRLDLSNFSDEMTVFSSTTVNIEIMHEVREELKRNGVEDKPENWLPVFYEAVRANKQQKKRTLSTKR